MNVHEARATYGEDADKVLAALDVLKERVKVGQRLSSPEEAEHYLQLTMAHREREQFRVIYVDVKNRVIEDSIEFMGTLTMAAVFPREIVRHAMRCNAASVLLCHNHPGGDSSPSIPDIELTARLAQALRIVDVHILDHVIVSSHDTYSFGDHGLLTAIDMAVQKNDFTLRREMNHVAAALDHGDFDE